ncbi:hypothetical protein AVEN_150901-1 [Araneus ventricosus]|uniref:Uncharacterized protein n=1 Tax=Araneus ventricosus TaxID=182803 RepID=A0A4Y2C8H2_ARAVE|nr:hypothetical protein AVEN_150901-1 [Araneus ventricosus]
MNTKHGCQLLYSLIILKIPTERVKRLFTERLKGSLLENMYSQRVNLVSPFFYSCKQILSDLFHLSASPSSRGGARDEKERVALQLDTWTAPYTRNKIRPSRGCSERERTIRRKYNEKCKLMKGLGLFLVLSRQKTFSIASSPLLSLSSVREEDGE